MMTLDEQGEAIERMQGVSSAFYMQAVRIGNHPFIEFAGLMNEYIKACRDARDSGVDFSDCSAHSGLTLPLQQHQLEYIQDKLNCIFGGRIRIEGARHEHEPD